MPVVKGGVWTNIEDEILKASVSKYGLNQWARVSSLLARKTPKQCKARWAEWLDPGIRKVEWSKEEDEKLLHLAKLMPTQWRTIAPIVGRTATQCLERYQRLLDEAEARENEDLSLGGPAGGESAAPSADDVRKLRPGELDPDPESKPARPDTIDLDEDEKEMLSEARARLANTQGKKAKRKARERQLEESRRLAVLQKRRELKASGINIKVTTRKKGEMDYNADIPFEKAPAPGFYDTQEEMQENETEREAFDPRKQQLANKRKGDGEGDDGPGKRQKKNKDSGNEALAAAAKAGQLAKLRQAEQNSKRRGLVLPAPQVSDVEMDDIVKMGMAGQKATLTAGDNDSTRGLVGDYSNQVGATPIRTPRAPQKEDRVANEIRNARLRTETQSALLGGENAEIDDIGTTGYQGAAPSKQTFATPNPLATPYRQGNGVGATPAQGPGATPMRTPRDTFRLNHDGNGQLIAQTPRDMRLREQAVREDIRSRLSALPRPKETEWELELPEEQDETKTIAASEEDSGARDERLRLQREAEARAELKRQSQVVQRGLPRPTAHGAEALVKSSSKVTDPVKREIAETAAALMLHDACTFNKSSSKAPSSSGQLNLSPEARLAARKQVLLELESASLPAEVHDDFATAWEKAHALPGLAAYADDNDEDAVQPLKEKFNSLLSTLQSSSTLSTQTESKLQKLHGGYIARSTTLGNKIAEAAAFLAKTKLSTETARQALVAQQAALYGRAERARTELEFVARRERDAQEEFRDVSGELQGLLQA
ncbi:hypothetical protein ANO11243_066430 [Dothideomycetidae sp. 11243]|nr:hypothetical protein ANO11243_066430 [fungal sp. No.11243]